MVLRELVAACQRRPEPGRRSHLPGRPVPRAYQ